MHRLADPHPGRPDRAGRSQRGGRRSCSTRRGRDGPDFDVFHLHFGFDACRPGDRSRARRRAARARDALRLHRARPAQPPPRRPRACTTSSSTCWCRPPTPSSPSPPAPPPRSTRGGGAGRRCVPAPARRRPRTMRGRPGRAPAVAAPALPGRPARQEPAGQHGPDADPAHAGRDRRASSTTPCCRSTATATSSTRTARVATSSWRAYLRRRGGRGHARAGRARLLLATTTSGPTSPSLDVSVLPYRFGTHSGWLEACRDLADDRGRAHLRLLRRAGPGRCPTSTTRTPSTRTPCATPRAAPTTTAPGLGATVDERTAQRRERGAGRTRTSTAADRVTAPPDRPLRICLVACCRFPIGEPFTGGLESHDLAPGPRADPPRPRGRPSSPRPAPIPTSASIELPVDSLPDHPGRLDVGAPPHVEVAEHHAYLALMLELAGRRAGASTSCTTTASTTCPSRWRRRCRCPMLTTLHTPPLSWLESAVQLDRRRQLASPPCPRFTARARGRTDRGQHLRPQRRRHRPRGPPVPAADRRRLVRSARRREGTARGDRRRPSRRCAARPGRTRARRGLLPQHAVAAPARRRGDATSGTSTRPSWPTCVGRCARSPS